MVLLKMIGKCFRHVYSDPKKFWKYVNTSMKVKNGISKLVLGNGNTVETDEQKSQALNLFFSSVFQNETDNISALNCASKSDGVCLPEVVITPAAVFNKLKHLILRSLKAMIEYLQGYYLNSKSSSIFP